MGMCTIAYHILYNLLRFQKARRECKPPPRLWVTDSVEFYLLSVSKFKWKKKSFRFHSYSHPVTFLCHQIFTHSPHITFIGEKDALSKQKCSLKMHQSKLQATRRGTIRKYKSQTYNLLRNVWVLNCLSQVKYMARQNIQ